MKGTTNALVYRGGGTSLIYAYNGEESGWSAGEKAYISNRLRTQEGRQHLETPSKTYSASTAFYGVYLSGVLQKRGFCHRGEPGALCQLGYFGELQLYRRQDVCLRARDEHTP